MDWQSDEASSSPKHWIFSIGARDDQSVDDALTFLLSFFCWNNVSVFIFQFEVLILGVRVCWKFTVGSILKKVTD